MTEKNEMVEKPDLQEGQTWEQSKENDLVYELKNSDGALVGVYQQEVLSKDGKSESTGKFEEIDLEKYNETKRIRDEVMAEIGARKEEQENNKKSQEGGVTLDQIFLGEDNEDNKTKDVLDEFPAKSDDKEKEDKIQGDLSYFSELPTPASEDKSVDAASQSFVEEIKSVASQNSQQINDTLSVEGLAEEVKAVANSGENQEREKSQEIRGVASPEGKENQNENRNPDRADSPEQEQSLMRKLLNSIPIFGKMIADALLGDEHEGKKVVSVEVSHPGFKEDSIQKNVINSVNNFNQRLSEALSAQVFGKEERKSPVVTPKENYSESTITEPVISEMSPKDSAPEIVDEKADEKDQDLGKVLKKCIEDAKDDPEKLKKMEEIIEKYQKWNEADGNVKDPELKNLTDQCHDQIGEIKKEKEQQRNGYEQEPEVKEQESEEQEPEKTAEQESENEGRQSNSAESPLITQIADSNTSNEMSTLSDSEENLRNIAKQVVDDAKAMEGLTQSVAQEGNQITSKGR